MSVAIWQPTVESTVSDYAGMLQERMQAHAHVARKVEQLASTSDEGLLVASRHSDTLAMEATIAYHRLCEVYQLQTHPVHRRITFLRLVGS